MMASLVLIRSVLNESQVQCVRTLSDSSPSFVEFDTQVGSDTITCPCDPVILKISTSSVSSSRCCRICSEQFDTLGQLTRHARFTHWSFRCKHCDMPCKDERMLNQHILRMHTTLACPDCGRTFTTKKALRIHIRRCRGQTYRCTCGKIFNHRDNMVRHQRTIHSGVKPYMCSVCERRFSDHSNMKRHMRRKH